MTYKFKYGNKEIFVPKVTESLLYKYDLGPNVNLNSLTQEGYYHQPANVNTSIALNYPTNEAGLLTVINRSYIYQVYHSYNNSGYWYRTQYSGTWYGWKKVTSTDMLTWNNLSGKPGSFVPSNHSHGYATWLGAQYASGTDWMGWYSSYGGSRRGYIQNNGDFHIQNETGGVVHIGTGGAYACNVYLEKGSGSYSGGHFYPGGSGNTTLGLAANRWFRLYQSYSTIDTSDARYKEDITSFDKRYEDFFMELKPIHHKWKNLNKEDNHDRKHGAFIAQEVKQALYNNDLTEDDFGFYCYDEDVSSNGELPYKDLHSLAYTEMIPLNTHMIQKLYKTVEQQQKQIDKLKKKLDFLI